MVDDTKVNKESDKGTGIRTLKSEKIKGVDVMVNRAIERILAADTPTAGNNNNQASANIPANGDKGQVKSKPRKRTALNSERMADDSQSKKTPSNKKAAPKMLRSRMPHSVKRSRIRPKKSFLFLIRMKIRSLRLRFLLLTLWLYRSKNTVRLIIPKGQQAVIINCALSP